MRMSILIDTPKARAKVLGRDVALNLDKVKTYGTGKP